MLFDLWTIFFSRIIVFFFKHAESTKPEFPRQPRERAGLTRYDGGLIKLILLNYMCYCIEGKCSSLVHYTLSL